MGRKEPGEVLRNDESKQFLMDANVLLIRCLMCIRVWVTGVVILLAILHPCLVWSAVSSGADFTAALKYVDLGKGGQAWKILSDTAGNTVVVGTISNDQLIAYGSPTPTGKIIVTKLDSAGSTVFRFIFGSSGYNEPRAAAIDAQGNIYIAGRTFSSLNDFPLVNALMPNALGPGFVAKVDPTGSRLLFSTRLGGITTGAEVGALALDPQANVYVTGSTPISDFPVTPGAFQGNLPNPGPGTYAAFVVKLSSAGDRLIYSTLLGGPRGGHTGAGAIAVDSSGQATVAGGTADRDFPVTPGAFQTICSCGLVTPPPFNQVADTGFVTRLNATGTALVWSTYFGGTAFVVSGFLYGQGGVTALALDDAGNVFVTGFTASSDFPTTPGVVQPTIPRRDDLNNLTIQNAFAAKMNSSGAGLVYSTYLAGMGHDIGNAIAVDPQGHAWLTGTTTSPDFPALPGSLSLGNAFLFELETDASRFVRCYRLPAGSAGQSLAVISPTEIVTLGPSGAAARWSFGVASTPSILAVANAAAAVANGHVAPGEIVSIYGVGLGPTPGAGAQLDENGSVATYLGGVQAWFDGVSAPMLYVSDTQINLIVPFGVSGKESTTLQVMLPSGLLPPLSLIVTAAEPSIFRNGDGNVAALNEDGSINGPQNPAKKGSIVTIYVNGAGLLDPLPGDGTITGTVLAKPTLPVVVGLGAVPVAPYETLYIGAAPGLVAGVLQVNVRLPQENRNSPGLAVVVGGVYSDLYNDAPIIYTTQ
jgi:uncharacterized protein (TIGR03437 family)